MFEFRLAARRGFFYYRDRFYLHDMNHMILGLIIINNEQKVLVGTCTRNSCRPEVKSLF